MLRFFWISATASFLQDLAAYASEPFWRPLKASAPLPEALPGLAVRGSFLLVQ